MANRNDLKVFVVEDDEWYCDFLEYNLKLNEENTVQKFHNAKDILAKVHENPDVITLDYSLPDMDGEQLLKRIKDYNEDIQVIVISGQEDISTAVQLLKQGAYDYIVKNEETRDRLFNILNNIRNNLQLRNEISQLKEEIGKKYDFSNTIVGNSTAIKKIFALVEKACQSKITVSITGETGTGKEVVAKSIHYNSHRKKMPFVPVNITAIPSELIESELFGHEKGAFTGANAKRIGKFEEANGGTIFLDEIGEMDFSLQAKLLRVLQEREVTRVGGNKTIPIDVRVICATHRNLADQVKNGKFREDLYYRLLGLPIQLPPLRERGNDILLIADFFVQEYCKDNGINSITINSAAKNKLLKYPFPGNVRELKAVMELACVMADNYEIDEGNIIFNSSNSMQDILMKEMTLREYTTKIIKTFLEKYDNNVLEVAKKLDIGKSTIYRMMQNNEL
tara:strand:+ start:3386 stop:4738 length:1353 start_codon:yes stop_codon:yes gene_type:complete